MSELWANVKDKNSKINLWCNGLKDESLGNQSQKRKQKASNDKIMPSKKKKDTEFKGFLTTLK